MVHNLWTVMLPLVYYSQSPFQKTVEKLKAEVITPYNYLTGDRIRVSSDKYPDRTRGNSLRIVPVEV